MTLNSFEKHQLKIFDNVNHHKVDLDNLLMKQLEQSYPKIMMSITADDFEIGVHENHQWGETIFDITWTEHFMKAIESKYPESLI